MKSYRFSAAKDTQTEGDENILGGMQSDTKAEMEMMKKMFQGKIKNLNERLEKEVNARRDDIEAQKKRQAEMDAELKKAKEDKNRLMQNAKRKILALKKELDEEKAKDREITPEAKEQPAIQPKVAAGDFN